MAKRERPLDSGICIEVNAGDLRTRDRLSKRVRWSWLLFGIKPKEPAPSHLGPVETPSTSKTGICCSGGGIRSASFNLGALQALAEEGRLQSAEYLAAVSGGSYIAAGMTMVAKRWGPPGSACPERGHQGHDDSDPDLFAADLNPFYRGSPEEQYLRNRSSYLAPAAAGKLSLGYRVLLGFLFNLGFLTLVLAPLGFFLGLFYRWHFGALVSPVDAAGAYCSLGSPGCNFDAQPGAGSVAVLVSLVVCGLAVGLWSVIWRFERDSVRALAQTWSLRVVVAVGVAAALLIVVPEALAALRNLSVHSSTSAITAKQVKAVGTVGGTSLATVLLGVFLQLRSRLSEPASALENIGAVRKWFGGLSSALRTGITYLAGAIAGPLLLLAITLWFTLLTIRTPTVTQAHWASVLASLAIFGYLYFTADLTTWSMHPYYRRRLSTAFSLKRIRGPERADGKPSPAEARERRYAQLEPIWETSVEPDDAWPTLLVCAAANISNAGATPPGRGVTSFTFSAHSLGGPLVGGLSTQTFAQTLPKERYRDFTLIAAVAMSGAALSPSMGKLTRRPLTFLLALANIRLGVWVPNPRRVADWSKRHPDPTKKFNSRPRPSYLLRELLGLNSVNAKFLYVTDGGHYENLGLVELLRRGCANVYCFDASGGRPGTFATLGDAIALARSELCVEITIDPTPLTPDASDARHLAPMDCVTGSIEYADGTRGRLVYARTVVTKDAPWDVQAYHETDIKFPNDPTADQLYTDQKFEAYRALGHLAGRHAIASMEARQAPTSVAVPDDVLVIPVPVNG